MASGKSKKWIFGGIAALVGVIVVALLMAPGSEKEKRVVSRSTARTSLPPSSMPVQVSTRLTPGQERAPGESNPQDLALRGDQYFENKQFDQAIELYKKVLKLDPKDVDTYNDLGLSYYYTGNPGLAADTLKKGTETNPLFQRIWLSLGFVLGSSGNTEGAISALKKAADLNPNNGVGQEAARLLQQIQ